MAAGLGPAGVVPSWVQIPPPAFIAFKKNIPISFETSYVTRLILVWAGRFGKIPFGLKTFLEDKEVERRVKSCFIPYR